MNLQKLDSRQLMDPSYKTFLAAFFGSKLECLFVLGDYLYPSLYLVILGGHTLERGPHKTDKLIRKTLFLTDKLECFILTTILPKPNISCDARKLRLKKNTLYTWQQ